MGARDLWRGHEFHRIRFVLKTALTNGNPCSSVIAYSGNWLTENG